MPGRDCTDCTLCCTILGIQELNKPPGVECPHVKTHVGCTIYERRPRVCAAFYCGFLHQPDLAAHWRPKRSRMVLRFEDEARRIEAHVDPAKPDAWRKEPYYSELKAWARISAPLRRQVIVCVSQDDVIAILPDRDKRLGRVGQDETLACIEYQTPTGNVIYDVIVVKLNDPRIIN